MNPKTHLNHDQLISYINHALSDVQREVFDRHLAECPLCRAMVTESNHHQHQIETELKIEINSVNPPPEMSFTQISPRLNRKRYLWQRIENAVPIAAVTVGLVLALVGVWQTLIDSQFTQINANTVLSGPFPALACFFFMFVSMDQYDRSFSVRPRFILAIILSIFLWLGSSVLGLLNIIVVRDLTIAAYIFSGGSPEGAGVVAILAVILATMAIIGVIIGGAEYHYKHIGQPGSWKLFVWTIAIQLLILVLPYLIL